MHQEESKPAFGQKDVLISLVQWIKKESRFTQIFLGV